MNIGEKIRLRREELGMSQDELAKKCGYASRVSVSKIESGQREVPKDKVELFARALNMLPEYLMGWTDEDGITMTDADFVDDRLQTIIDRATKDSDYKERLIKIAELLEK